MKVAWLAGVALVAVVAGGGWWVWSDVEQRRADESQVAGLLHEARVEFGRDALARPEAAALSRKIAQHRLSSDARLIRARARLLLLLGRTQEAWEAERGLAKGLEPERQDMLLAARILIRLHGIRDDLADVEQAMSFAEECMAGGEDAKTLFLAWQCARRAGREEDESRHAESLMREYPDTPEARLVQELASPTISLDALRQLELEFDRRPPDLPFGGIPEELDFAMAVQLVRVGGPAQLDDALDRIERVLESFPASVDARNVASVVLHLQGDRAKRDLHLEWLLANAPENDARRDQWRLLLRQPAGSGR